MSTDYSRVAGRPAALHPPAAGPVPAGRGGEVARPLEGRRRRLLRARRPRRHRPAARRARRLLRRARLRAAARRRPSSAVTTDTKIVLDLESLSLPADEAGPLARYASTIQAQRGDYNGRVLSIRADDLRVAGDRLRHEPRRAHLAAHRVGRPLPRPGGHRRAWAATTMDDELDPHWERRRSPRSTLHDEARADPGFSPPDRCEHAERPARTAAGLCVPASREPAVTCDQLLAGPLRADEQRCRSVAAGQRGRVSGWRTRRPGRARR